MIQLHNALKVHSKSTSSSSNLREDGDDEHGIRNQVSGLLSVLQLHGEILFPTDLLHQATWIVPYPRSGTFHCPPWAVVSLILDHTQTFAKDRLSFSLIYLPRESHLKTLFPFHSIDSSCILSIPHLEQLFQDLNSLLLKDAFAICLIGTSGIVWLN